MLSPPSTPVINEENKDAALKLFAAYNGKKEHISPTITSIQQGEVEENSLKVRDIMYCGIQGGSVTLNPESDVERDILGRHGILKSYTIGSTSTHLKANRERYKKEARKFSSFAGSSFLTVPVESNVTEAPNVEVGSTEREHCYPDIKIINENNEDGTYSDSDGSVCDGISIIVPKKADETDVKCLEVTDSGYPSTTMSNTTQYSCQMEDTKPILTSAAQRRNLFTSKAKSASFYNIATDYHDEIPEGNKADNGVVHTKESSLNLSPCRAPHLRSFESEQCRSCYRQEVERLAFSYESQLDKVHKLKKRQYTHDEESACIKHRRGRHRHICGCPKTHRQCSREVCSYLKHGHRCKPEFYLTSYPNVGARNVYKLNHPESEQVCHYSSTDSDSFVATSHKGNRRRKQYHSKGHFSENDYHRRKDWIRSFDLYPQDVDHSKHHSFKTKQMKSFLKDAYNAKYRQYDNIDYIVTDNQKLDDSVKSSGYENAGRTKTKKDKESHVVLSRDCVRSHEYFEKGGSLENTLKSSSSKFTSNITSDIANTVFSNTTKANHSSSSDRNLSNTDDSVTGISEAGKYDIQVLKGKVKETLKQKDSAYQTKQSSVDRFKDDKAAVLNTDLVEQSADNGSNRQVFCKFVFKNLIDDIVKCFIYEYTRSTPM